MEKYCRAGQATDGGIIWRVRIACWIRPHTHTHTHTIFSTYIFSTATVVARTCSNVTLIRTLSMVLKSSFKIQYFCVSAVRKLDVVSRLGDVFGKCVGMQVCRSHFLN
jgi:hypothetical protein